MEHLSWGLMMTVVGMGLVFSMLALLWGLLTLVLALDKEPQPAAAVTDSGAVEPVAVDPAEERIDPAETGPPLVNGMEADLVAAILVATMKHRQILRREAAPIMRSTWPGSKLFASRWVAAGRARQTQYWQGRGR